MASVLELDVRRGDRDGRYVVSVISSPAGEATADVALDPYSLARDLPGLQQTLIASSVPSRRLVGTREGLVREVGRRLFDALFAQDVSGVYRASCAVAAERGEPLRIVLRLGAPELATLPWESLFDPTTDSFVSRREPLVRHVPVPSSPPPLRITLPLRILALISSPRGLPPLDIDKERDNLTRAVAPLAARGLVSVEWIDHTTWASLQDSLLSDSWHVVHFIGHGDFDDVNDEGVLALETESGRLHRIPAESFVDLLREAQPMPRLVFLNACDSATSGQTDLFSGAAAALVRGGVSAVTAMQFEISDQAAIAFSRGFYTAIGRGRGVDEAVKSGRIAIVGLGEGSLEWITPTLHLRGRETHLFELDDSSQAAHLSVIEQRARAAAAVEAQDAATAVPLLDSVLAAAPDDVTAQRDRKKVLASGRSATTPKRDREAVLETGRSAPAPQREEDPRTDRTSPLVDSPHPHKENAVLESKISTGRLSAGEEPALVRRSKPASPMGTPSGTDPDRRASETTGTETTGTETTGTETTGTETTGTDTPHLVPWWRRLRPRTLGAVSGTAMVLVILLGLAAFSWWPGGENGGDGNGDGSTDGSLLPLDENVLLLSHANENGIKELVAVDTDTQEWAVVPDSAGKLLPAISPDRDWAIYMDRKDPIDLRNTAHVVGPDGTDRLLLGEEARQRCPYTSRPAWSPDGTLLAAICVADKGNGVPTGLVVIGRDGTFVDELLRADDLVGAPSWGENELVYFTRDRGGTKSIWAVPGDGSAAEKQMDLGPGSVGQPDWSPSGLLYLVGEGQVGDVWVLTPQGTSDQITTVGTADSPNWSPDRSTVAWLQGEDATHSSLRLASYPDGEEITIPDLEGDLGPPSWSSR